MLTVTNGLFLTMADGDEPFTGWMSVGDDGRISGIGRGEPPADPGATVLNAAGKIIAPGFVSAHSHLHTSGLRGLAVGETLYPWVRANNEVLLGATDEDMYWSVLHGCLDFLGNGITSAYNFALSRVVWLYDELTGDQPGQIRDEEFVTRQFDAAADSGLRVLTAIRLDDEAFGEAQALAQFDAAATEVANRTPLDEFLGVSVYGAVQWSSTPGTAELEAGVMARHGITNQAHFVETAANLEAQQAKFEWYARAGALGPGMLFGHFVHPTDEMVDAVAEAGCAVVWQPTSNGRLGSGIADVVRYRERGIRLGIGLDDQSCTDISDPFGNMRLGMYTQRARYSEAAVLMPREVLRMHTLGSAEVLGVGDRVGSLEVGKFADFLVVDPGRPDTGPVWDIYATYVLACGTRNVEQVYVGGELTTVDGRSRHPLAGEVGAELRGRMREAARRRGLPEPVVW